jgi:hypothetical protein
MGLRFLRIAVASPVIGELLARIHFWLHNRGLPMFMIALGMLLTGTEAAGLAVAISSNVLLIALILFATNVLVNGNSAA